MANIFWHFQYFWKLKNVVNWPIFEFIDSFLCELRCHKLCVKSDKHTHIDAHTHIHPSIVAHKPALTLASQIICSTYIFTWPSLILTVSQLRYSKETHRQSFFRKKEKLGIKKNAYHPDDSSSSLQSNNT